MKGEMMNIRKEMIWGLVWGLMAELLLILISFAAAHSAQIEKGGAIDISISGDSVQINLDKDGLTKTVTVSGDSLTKTPSGIRILKELVIDDGRIYIDSIELTESELKELSISQDIESAYSFQAGEKEHRRIKRKRLATVYSDNGTDIARFEGVIIDVGDKIAGNVVSISGNVTILGEVHGNVVSVFGDIYLKNGARVYGDVSAPFGNVLRDNETQVKGEIIPHRKNTSKARNTNFNLSARYNRVEGLAIRPGLTFKDDHGKLPTLDIETSYAFSLKRWEYNFAIDHRIGRQIGPYFTAGLFQEARTSDGWIITEVENTIAALILKEDFYDYYWERGFVGGTGLFYGKFSKAGIDFTAAKISNLEKNTDWAIFGGHKHFRQNWSTIYSDTAAIKANAGDLREINIHATYDTRDNANKPHSGIYGNISWRQTVNNDSGNFNYKMFTADVRSYIPIAASQTLAVGFRTGFSNDSLPLFCRFFIGGIGSLRGYSYKEFDGNRYLMANMDYVWQFYSSHLGAGFFFDMGKAGFSRQDFRSADLKTDIGIAFLIENSLRIDLAQRLDDLNKSPVVTARGIILF
jgi:hypothetical protein